LIEAMQRVWPTHPHAQLVIAGACGSASPQIKARIEALPLDRRAQVKLISDFSEAEKPSLLAACDLFVLASGQESFGIAFVEAWGCAKPVIGARVGAMSSLISEGRDGLLFDYDQPDSLAEAICRLIEDQSMQARFGTAGQQKVLQHYTWDIVTDRVRQVYQQAIARHQTAGKH
jgi:glycosyltransferase involved in cell wall biosynthesis